MRRSATFAALALAATSPFAVALDSGGAPPVPAGKYTLDKSHTSLIFRVSHMGFSTYTGRFTNVDAKLDFDPARLANSRVNVTIDPRSIDADNAPSGFLEMLSGKDWLDAAKFPEMAFRSKAVEVTGANTFRVRGELTLHGVTEACRAQRELQRRLRRPSHGPECAHWLLGAGQVQAFRFRCVDRHPRARHEHGRG